MFGVFVLFSLWAGAWGATCGAYGVSCVSQSQYQLCYVDNGSVVLTGSVQNCVNTGEVCNEASLNPCVLSTTTSTTTSTSTTTATPVPNLDKTCGEYGVYCTSPTSYQLCYVLNGTIVFETPAIQCVNSGEICSQTSITPCIISVPTTTTTSKAPGTTLTPARTCGVYGTSCLSATQYQLCYVINGNITLVGEVQTCVNSGQVCSEVSLSPCVNGSGSSTSSVFTTSSSLGTTTVTGGVTPPVSCTQNTNFTAPQCNQYYECIIVLWWYEIELLNCTSGQAFDSVTRLCQDSSSCTV